ncbi:MAG: glutamate--tRNA ligase [Magnetococcales bacterium]|nr:glutamate--tRNA ligase [Magnetococcales bacterium]
MTTRTRFAPSPTGFLHIGGARTALFCYLFARRTGGKYLLRVEDTDRERSTAEAVEVIFEGLRWMGLNPDEPPVFQARNAPRHLEVAHQLLREGKAYRCHCSKDEIDQLREQQKTQGLKPRYDGRCRSRSAPVAEGRESVIRLKTPLAGAVAWEDVIQGPVRIENNQLDDLILVRSDGTPTYHLAVVTDDHDMGITHIVRGEDHLNNTPRQIHIIEAMGWTRPVYAHMPLLHGMDGAKLSKRHGAVSVLAYRDAGFLPQAVNNYLARLGWSFGEQEIFTMAELERHFDIAQVGRSAAIFDQAKLEWVNGHHIRATAVQDLVPPLLEQLRRKGIAEPDPAYVAALVPTLQERARTLAEMADKALFYFVAPTAYDDKAVGKHLTAPVLEPFADLVQRLDSLEGWNEALLEATFQATIATHGVKMGKLAQPVRVALTGSDVSPGVYEVLARLGRSESLTRLERCLAFFRRRVAE